MELLNISEIGELPRSYSGHRGELTPGELGCTLSHLIAIDEFLATKNKFLFILEDNAEPVDINEINRIVEAIQEYALTSSYSDFEKTLSQTESYKISFGKHCLFCASQSHELTLIDFCSTRWPLGNLAGILQAERVGRQFIQVVFITALMDTSSIGVPPSN